MTDSTEALGDGLAAGDWAAVPVFGAQPAGGAAVMRPSAYAVLPHPARGDELGGVHLAVVRTPHGVYLPGGGVAPGESPEDAVRRESREECGLAVRPAAGPGAWRARAVEHVYAAAEGTDGTHYAKHCTFVAAELLGGAGAPDEPDHVLDWLTPAEAVAVLAPAGHRWAVAEWHTAVESAGSGAARTGACAAPELVAALAPVRGLLEGPLRDHAVPWAVAGGWALDLALGRVTRPHADVDVAVFRADQAALRAALAGWTFEVVVAGERRPWHAGVWLAPPAHETYATPPGGGPALELLLNERDGTDWVFRRDAAVRLPLARAVWSGAAGLPALAPEVVLLYKAKAPRAADERDFAAARPLLGPEARAWLAAALSRCHPGHPWLDRLA